MCAAGPFRGEPASITMTRRRALASTRAALKPAAPPPTTAMSTVVVCMPRGCHQSFAQATFVAVSGKQRLAWRSMAEGSPAIPNVLAKVGPRLRQLRPRRGITLTELAGRTGTSKSPLSGLEAGQRKPSLDLLLPLAEAYQVPLDELVGAPDVGDPRIRLKARKRNGRFVSPLTQQSSGVQVNAGITD